MKYLIAAFAVAVLVLGLACSDDDDDGGAPTESTAASATPGESATATDQPQPTPAPTTPIDVCAENPDPATPDTVLVDQPAAGDRVTSPIQVSGRISAFEATFALTLYDANGELLLDQVGMSAEGNTLAPFSEMLAVAVPTATPACLWVYEKSAADGRPVHIFQVPLVILP